ncbi:hypothetical protein HZY88_02645 [Aerococcaceae bacterium DSM 111176]|nr:hypothetical protein [Aerococcaceae bacterium DSM 111176]
MELIEEITGYEAIPDEMKVYPNWVVYKKEIATDSANNPKVNEHGEPKYTKVPYDPKTKRLASSTDKNTWGDFHSALAVETEFDGLGFMFSESPFMGVDLDDVREQIADYESGNENNIVGEFHNQLKTYMEVSPSGNGIHFILKGTLPEGKRKIGDVEMYDKARYFTVTGEQMGDYDEINPNGTEAVKSLHFKYLGAENNISSNFNNFEAIPSYGNGLNAEEVLQALKKSKDGDKWIELLTHGDWHKYGYHSRSDAELAVVSKLGFFSNYDKHVMDEICKSSILIDEKWERPSSPTKVYTLAKVIANRPKDGGYKAKNDFNLKIKDKTTDMKQLKHNAQPPTLEDFDKKNAHVLPDKNGVLWYLHEFASEREPEVRLVKKYYNYENMANIVTDMIYNEFSEVVEYSNEGSHEMVDDPYISEMYSKISQLYIDVPQKDLYHIVNNLGRKDSYHPIKQLIESVEWDKQERIDVFFIDYFGLSDTSYHREATRKWFIGAITRLYEPGVKFDMVPIIRGAQGVGKTTAIERLAFGLDYYLSLNGEKVSDKDTMQLLRDSWLVELEELEFLSNNTDGSIKKFFSSRDDKYREPYGKSQRNYKRHSVFIGTVNNKSFLTDKTGNRRYYPLVIEDDSQGKYQVFSNLTKDVVHQIWAEALTYYKDKEGLVCSPETENAFDVIRGNVMEEDVTEQTLVDFLNLELPQEYYEATIEQKRLYLNGSGNKNWHIEPALRPDITTREILIECFGREIDADFRGDKSAKRINSIMENLPGWKKTENLVRIGVDGKRKRPRGFERS